MRKFTVLFFVGLLLFSCKSSKEITTKPVVTKLNVSEKENIQFTSLYVEAANFASIENYDKAIKLYEKCKVMRPENAAVYYELSRLYARKKNAQLAVDNAEKAIELSPKNKWYLLQTATVYRATGQNKKSITAFEQLVKIDKKNLSVLYELAHLYQKNYQYKDAAGILTKIENISGKNPQMSYQKYLLLTDAGDEKAGLNEIKNILKQDPKNGMGNLAMAQHYQKKGEEEKVYEHLIYVFEDPTIRSDNKLNIVMDYLNKMGSDTKKREQTLKLINLMLEAHPKDVKSYIAAGDYYGKLGELGKANEYYEKSLEYSTNAYPIFMQLMDNSFNQKEYKKVVSLSNKALELYPTQPIFYLYQGMANRELKQYEKAIKSFKNGRNILVDNEKLLFDLYTKMAETYHELKDYSNSDKFFEKAMSINGLEPFMLNNYSYYLSLRKEKLEKAAELSKKANNIYPNNASFNDTYGWILFQQGNFTDAEIWLKKSLENGGDKSGTVLEHYGDVMIQLNRPSEAIKYWQKAKLTGEHTNKISDKIKDKKYYE